MHILWLVKTVLPQAAAACGLAGASDVSGSWLTGQLAALRPHRELRLTVACTDARQKASLRGEQDGVSYRILPGADGFSALLQTEQPDLVHIWGTGYVEFDLPRGRNTVPEQIKSAYPGIFMSMIFVRNFFLPAGYDCIIITKWV